MTLFVADDRRSLADVLPTDVSVVGAAAVGDAVACDTPDVVVVDSDAVADPSAVVDAIRSNADETAVVVAGTAAGVDADVTCATPDEASLRAAVERAEQIAAYRNSVSALYAACRERALGGPDDDLDLHRQAADERFASLPDDREAFHAALRPEGRNG